MATSPGSDHYFAADPSAPTSPGTVALDLPDLSLSLATDAGVFGRGRVDPGSKLLLLDGPAPTPGDRNLVDLGAGYGPIAITLATRNPQAVVWAVDVNRRALELCRANAERAGVSNVRAVEPSEVPQSTVIDRIWSNPPIRIGKQALRSLLVGWLERLGPDGTAHLVVQKHLGSDSLQRWLQETGWPTERRRSRASYRLLDVRRPETAQNGETG